MGLKPVLFTFREEHRLEVGFEVPTAVTEYCGLSGFTAV
jgi:hypothetical protein